MTADAFTSAAWLGEAIAAPSSPADAAADAEGRLINAAIAGDQWACTRLVADHQEAVYRFCLRWLRRPEDARDACQETFVRAFRSIADYEHRGRFLSWLFRIAMNLCRDHARSKAARHDRVTVGLDRVGDAPCPAHDPAEAAAAHADLARLFAGIDALPRRHREVIVLCGIEGLSHDLCAEVLDCSPRAIEGRLRRAREALEAWLASPGV